MPVSNNNFMDKLLRDVEKCFESEKNKLIEFLNTKGFNNTQSDELAFAMRRAVYYLKINKAERKKIGKATMKYIREGHKKNKEIITSLLDKDKLDILRENSSDERIDYKLIQQYFIHQMQLVAMPRAGTNIFFRLALAPFFWKLKKWGFGQVKQINLLYNLFVKYKLDDYGTEFDDGEMYIGEKEQKERIRNQFQQPAFKYWKEFDQNLGWI